MKYRKIVILLCLLMVFITGCNQNDTSEVTDTKTDVQTGETIASDTGETEDMTVSETSKNEIEYFTVTKDTPMENRGLLLELIGSAVYDKIEGEDYTDTPSEGKTYLVLYLSIKNRTGKDEYFNYNNITAKLDGEEITDVFLMNSPLGYSTIKTHLINEMITQGYLVWEVPENWEKLEVTYTGWTPTYYTEPTIVVTPDDLEEPEEYKEDNRII